jgi:hypothetical protein
MWQKSLDFNVMDEKLRAFTTAIWDFVDGEKTLATVGVIRMSSFSDPYLWLKARGSTYSTLKRVMEHMTELQTLMAEPVIYAEVDKALPMNYKFLTKCGFVLKDERDDRILMVREV